MPEWALPLIIPPAWLKSPGPATPAPAGTGSGTAPATGQAAADAQKLQAMKDLLKKSATGAAAVKYLEDKNITVEFATGGGSYWDGTKVVIDRNHSTERAGLAVVHEINHARSTLEGTKPDIMTETRDNYVRKMLEEEVKGTVDSIRTKNELIAGGTAVTATYPLEAKYNEAYKAASEKLQHDTPTASAADLKAAGDRAGYDAVMKGFKDGAVVTSITVGGTKPTYPDYYGGAWDGKHPRTP